ncbi:hypothetical protein ThvES_00008180 [Thiovulum sp. ES]|nr:hypothetical protein ThvES_00008180 [Thiovulum sp. ES]
MPFPTLSQIRDVRWGSEHTWDIQFLNAPPLSAREDGNLDIFPATSVEIEYSADSLYTIEYPLGSFEIPKSQSFPNISITFIDDELGTIYLWFKDWLDQIYAEDGVATIGEEGVLREVFIFKLNSLKEILHTEKYVVYPIQRLSDKLSSNAKSKEFTVNLNVIGKVFYKD